MAYTTINKSSLHQDGKIYLGSSSAVTVTGLGFQPDFVWVKDRDNGNNHCLVDAVRGVGKYIQSDNTSIEVNNSTNSISAFTSDGFTTGTANPANEAGSATLGFMSWNWKANGAGSANTDGSINTTATSANTTAGFSIVTWTGTGSNPKTVGHGLGAVPRMIITKRLSGDVASWHCYHAAIGNAHDIYLNGANAKASDTTWNSTTPTSSVFTVNGANVNVSGAPYIAYCFAEKTGYSKFGSYTGNGNANGTFVYTGFKPAFVIVKRTDATNNWHLFDNKRDTFNPTDINLYPNLSNAEFAETDGVDFLSNGFKMRESSSWENASGGTYIYMAFGQSLVGSNNVPCTAR